VSLPTARILIVTHREGIRDLMGSNLRLPYCAIARFTATTTLAAAPDAPPAAANAKCTREAAAACAPKASEPSVRRPQMPDVQYALALLVEPIAGAPIEVKRRTQMRAT
jgi:hypothetical protein